MRKLNIATMLVAFALLAALPAMTNLQAAYAEPKDKIILRDNGSFADASWYDETPEGVATYTSLFVAETSKGTDIYVSKFVSNPDGTYTDTFGYAFTKDDVFNISAKLKTASLSPTDIEVYVCTYDGVDYYCDFDTITVQADWTGVGDIQKTRYKSSFTTDDFKVRFSETTSFRQATATGSINDDSLGDSDYAELGKFKRAEMQSGQF